MSTIQHTACALIASLLTVGHAHADEKKPTPEERAYEFRTSLFQTFAWKMGGLVGAKIANDSAGFNKHATDLQNLTVMLEEGFQIKYSLPDGTAAKAEIWDDFDKFEERATTLRTAVAGLTEEGAIESFDPKDFGSKNCGGCHRDFKVKE
ncbi:MAG: cytochrome c556 [Halieaceae bacterium]|jgi:cytochrome c556